MTGFTWHSILWYRNMGAPPNIPLALRYFIRGDHYLVRGDILCIAVTGFTSAYYSIQSLLEKSNYWKSIETKWSVFILELFIVEHSCVWFRYQFLFWDQNRPRKKKTSLLLLFPVASTCNGKLTRSNTSKFRWMWCVDRHERHASGKAPLCVFLFL